MNRYSSDLRALVDALLSKDPSLRPSALDMMHHPAMAPSLDGERLLLIAAVMTSLMAVVISVISGQEHVDCLSVPGSTFSNSLREYTQMSYLCFTSWLASHRPSTTAHHHEQQLRRKSGPLQLHVQRGLLPQAQQ